VSEETREYWRNSDAVAALFRSLDKRFKVVLAAIGVFNGANSLTLNYNQLYAVTLEANPVSWAQWFRQRDFLSSLCSCRVV